MFGDAMEKNLHHIPPTVAADPPEGTTSDMAVGHDRRRPELEAATDTPVVESAADTEQPTSKTQNRKSEDMGVAAKGDQPKAKVETTGPKSKK